ncbi:hypothetical protein BDW02DRAFT_504482 [Decorospora gaudefroyi]|uniref:Uncharacterized protein n=1 Tax=Decorospora gaudefroyi TaxID=184978 RepID=A0A6A5KBJ6_9PLEO|nr:hypothetical protein BDW02DRAFT_504482 [Decorospora gaudefroyi]
MEVDLMYLTGSKSRKRQKRSTQLDEYFDDLRDNITTADLSRLQLYVKGLNIGNSGSVDNSSNEAASNSGNSKDYGDNVG